MQRRPDGLDEAQHAGFQASPGARSVARRLLQDRGEEEQLGYPYEDFDDMIRVLTALTCELLYEAPPGSRRSGEPAIQPVDVVYDPL